MPAYNKPLPVVDELTRPFWEQAREHRLTVQRCNDCGDLHFPPSPVCPVCLSSEQDWQAVSGAATLMTWARFHRAYWDGYRQDLPYDVCVVRLAEGPVLVSNFAGPAPADARLGLPLRVVFDDVTDEISLPRFTPA